MSTSYQTVEMKFNFEAGNGWDDFSAEMAVEMMSHLPPSIEGLGIDYAPYGYPFMDAVIDWIEKKSTNLKSLRISHTFIGGGMKVNGGQDAGIKLAKVLAAKNTLETLSLDHTDLMGSRKVNEWVNALRDMTSLKSLSCMGMSECIKAVDNKLILDENSTMMSWIKRVVGLTMSAVDANSTVQHPDDKRQRIYWKGGTFPDATMKKEDVQQLKGATHAEDIDICSMYRDDEGEFLQ